MFSRSEKTEEFHEDMTEQSGQRSPMVLAALAGLLAIAGAFLLVWYLNNGSDDVASDEAAESGLTAESPNTRQVLIATREIPRGTSVRELIEAPTVYLSADVVSESVLIPSAIGSVGDLNELVGQVLDSDVLPGEQLLRDRFRDPSDFDSSDETFLEAVTDITAPPRHHAVVLELGAARALGGFFEAGQNVTVVASFRIKPPEGDSVEVTVTVLNEVEVLAVVSSLEVAGSIGPEADGVANRGTYTVTLAVEPDELTDLAYAIEYGEILLATAVPGFDNEDDPRAFTSIGEIVGDDGVWLAELEDGNIVDVIGALGGPPADGEGDEDGEGRSIEVEIDDDEEVADEADNVDDGADEDADLIVDEEPGDS